METKERVRWPDLKQAHRSENLHVRQAFADRAGDWGLEPNPLSAFSDKPFCFKTERHMTGYLVDRLVRAGFFVRHWSDSRNVMGTSIDPEVGLGNRRQPGKGGDPDLLVVRDGVSWFVELKWDKRDARVGVRANQEYAFGLLRDAGASVGVFYHQDFVNGNLERFLGLEREAFSLEPRRSQRLWEREPVRCGCSACTQKRKRYRSGDDDSGVFRSEPMPEYCLVQEWQSWNDGSHRMAERILSDLRRVAGGDSFFVHHPLDRHPRDNRSNTCYLGIPGAPDSLVVAGGKTLHLYLQERPLDPWQERWCAEIQRSGGTVARLSMSNGGLGRLMGV